MKYLLLLLLLGCNIESKLNKINYKHPEAIAKFARDHYPCAESSIDTITNTEYDFIEIKCDTTKPDYYNDTIYINGKPKTYIVYKNKFIAVPEKTRIVTKLIRDSSCEVLLNNTIKGHKKDADWIKWLLILLAVSIILHLIRKR